MKINNYLLNEILQLNDVSSIDIIFYLFNDYAKIPEKQLFNSIFYLKSVDKVTTNNSYITDKIKTTLKDFIWCERINSNEAIFEFKPKYIEFFTQENLKRNYTEIDTSIIHRLKSLYSKKFFIFFEMNKFKINQRVVYNEITIPEIKTSLNISGYSLSSDFLIIVKRFFTEIKEMLPNYEFKISYKKQSRKIISLLCFFNEKPEAVDIFESEPTKKIPETKEETPKQQPEVKQENKTDILVPEIIPQPTKIENVVNYTPQKNEVNLIDMDNKEIDNIFGDIDDILNGISKKMDINNIVKEPEVIPEVKEIIPEIKKEIPVIKNEVKEEAKESKTLKEKLFDRLKKVDKFKFNSMFFDEEPFVTKLEIRETQKQLLIEFRTEWCLQNMIDNKYLPCDFGGGMKTNGVFLNFLKEETGEVYNLKTTIRK